MVREEGPGDLLVSGMWGALEGPGQVRMAGWLGGQVGGLGQWPVQCCYRSPLSCWAPADQQPCLWPLQAVLPAQ